MLETDSNGAITTDQKYLAYCRQRATGPVVTDHKFTNQKLDTTGLYDYNQVLRSEDWAIHFTRSACS